MSLINQTGFFTNYYQNIKNTCTTEDLENFSKLKTDLDRVIYISNLDTVRKNDLKLVREFTGKNSEQAAELKHKGNDAFKNKRWTEAMMFYSKSYIIMPEEKSDDIAIILANRSAALFHLENYDQTLSDISHAIKMGYPKNMIYKLYERQARCYLAKKNLPKALESFKLTIHGLDESNLPLEKRSKIERDALVMIKMLENELSSSSSSSSSAGASTSQKSKKSAKTNDVKKDYLNDSVTIEYSKDEGRFAKAKNGIQVGEELLVEKPNIAVLLEKYSKTHCQNCFIRTTVPIACPRCTDVIYCSEKCCNQANSSFHQFECGILTIIWRSGASVNCHMALRILTNKSMKYFNDIKDEIDKRLHLEQMLRLPNDDYRRICNLVRHEDKRTTSSFFQLTLIANFLTSCLQQTDYFNTPLKPDDFNLVNSLILRNLQFLQYNSHEIFELHKLKSGSANKTVFIGAGIYSTLALFNHSCDPGIVRYFQGTTVYINAIKPIKSGDIVAENYGPMYTQDTREERQQKLKDLYNFDCNCEACINNWPRFDDMDNSIVPFRCDSDEKCNNVIKISPNCNDFMIKCVACGQFTNILKGLKVMQDTEVINKTAKRFYDAGEINKALEKYLDLLKIMYEVLVPPFTDFCQCQQNIKDCFLHFGNSYILSQ